MVQTVKEMMNPKVKSVFLERLNKIEKKIFNKDKVIKVLCDSLSEVFPGVEFHNTDSKAVCGIKDPEYKESWPEILKYSGLKRIDFFLPSAYREWQVDDKTLSNKHGGYETTTLSSYCFRDKPTGQQLASVIEKDL